MALVKASHGYLRGTLLEKVKQDMVEGGNDDLCAGPQALELSDHAVDQAKSRLPTGLVGLDLDIGLETCLIHQIDETPQGREGLALEPGGEPASGIDARQVCDRQAVIATCPVRGAVQGRVVADDDCPVGDDIHVGFHPGNPMVHRAAKGCHRILGSKRTQASMPDDHAPVAAHAPTTA